MSEWGEAPARSRRFALPAVHGWEISLGALARPLLLYPHIMTILIVLSALLIAGLIVMTVELRNVPEGREDETGFHYVWRNFTTDTRDVACVWATMSEVAATTPVGWQAAA